MISSSRAWNFSIIEHLFRPGRTCNVNTAKRGAIDKEGSTHNLESDRVSIVYVFGRLRDAVSAPGIRIF